jgi:predicted MPP superfamily phosphohydrolase
VDLVLAGHLHGCQFVFKEHAERLLPGGWFYSWNCLRRKVGNCALIVSRGCADTLPFRWNCPREVVVCDLVPA